METKKRTSRQSYRLLGWYLCAGLLAAQFLSVASFADLIEMVNGDQYKGAVLSVTLTNVAVRSEVQGSISLPRAKVARITFGPVPAGPTVNLAPGSSAVQPSRAVAPRELMQALPAKGADTNVVARVQSDLLSQAGPEAVRKYSELARGLLTGSISMSDLRKQAQQTMQDAEAMKQDLGPEASELVDGYLEILRKFLSEPGDGVAKP